MGSYNEYGTFNAIRNYGQFCTVRTKLSKVRYRLCGTSKGFCSRAAKLFQIYGTLKSFGGKLENHFRCTELKNSLVEKDETFKVR